MNPDQQTTPFQTPQSITATKSHDNFGLGSTPGQRGAEILAGVRAEKSPSPETRALSRMSGRIIARIMLNMTRDSMPLNFTLARPMVIDGLIRKSLPAGHSAPVVIEIASGLAPRGLFLARHIPNIQVIEIDLPDVVAEKQKRLRHAGIHIPTNISWLSADLAVTPLTDVVGAQKAHVIAAEGLLPYLHHHQMEQLGRWTAECLHPGGVFIGDVPLRDGVQEIQQLASFFARQAGNWYGTLESPEVGQKLFLNAGFGTVETHLATHFAEEFKLPMPMIDVSCFIRATKAVD